MCAGLRALSLIAVILSPRSTLANRDVKRQANNNSIARESPTQTRKTIGRLSLFPLITRFVPPLCFSDYRERAAPQRFLSWKSRLFARCRRAKATGGDRTSAFNLLRTPEHKITRIAIAY